MKAFFRFLTAEFNGFYLSLLHNFLNGFTEPVRNLLAYTNSVQFKTEADDLTVGEYPMRNSDIVGIGKIAGLYIPLLSAESNLGSIMFTESKIIEGRSYSERGLFDMDGELFRFFRTTTGSYPNDITSLATSRLRASFIPEGAPVLGYIRENTQIFNVDGTVITENILPTPPVDAAYIPYYGDKYLFMAESFLIESYLDIDTYKLMLETYQKVRYNGANIQELIRVTKIIMQDYIKDISFSWEGHRLVMRYKKNGESEMPQKQKRTFVWETLLEYKYNQILPLEVIA